MFRFAPRYVPKTWGGRRLARVFGRALPPGPVGEAWELGELPEFHSTAPEGAIGDLWREGRLGGSARGPFPLLLKWLDTEAPLSVQVHPTPEACRRLGRGKPKTEAWYVAHAEEDAVLWLGMRERLAPEEFVRACRTGDILRALDCLRPRAGDLVPVQAGTVHAIGGGLLLLEVQEPSDTTFRLWDYGRPDTEGRPVPLHVDESLVAIDWDLPVPAPRRAQLVTPHFRMTVCGPRTAIPADDLRILAAAVPGARLDMRHGELVLGHGDIVVLAPEDGPCAVVAGEVVWVSEGSSSDLADHGHRGVV